jgi:hypothetical protein
MIVPMRNLVLASVAAALPLLAPAPASAQSYPWCSIYGGSTWSGGENCGFSTYRQCMENVSGIGGFCQRNPLYQPPAKRSKRGKTSDRYDDR